MSRKLRRNHWLISTHRYFQLNSPLHGSAQLRLLDLQLGQQIDEPLEGSLIPVYPKEVHLAQVHHRLGYFAGPLELASRTAVPGLPVSMHYGLSRRLCNKFRSRIILDQHYLQDRGKWSHSNARAYKHSMLGSKNVTGRRSIRTVDEDLGGEAQR